MIAQLVGKLLHKEPTYVILEVGGGIGYELHISLHTFTQIKALAHCTLLSSMQVKNEVYTLYGFYTQEEKRWWLLLISVSGIGPKMALTILSSLTTIELHRAILEKNERLLTAIKGIGTKAAQRILLELGDKAAKWSHLSGEEELSPARCSNEIEQDALTALMALGLTQKIAAKAIANVQKESIEPLTLEELIKKSLHAN